MLLLQLLLLKLVLRRLFGLTLLLKQLTQHLLSLLHPLLKVLHLLQTLLLLQLQKIVRLPDEELDREQFFAFKVVH